MKNERKKILDGGIAQNLLLGKQLFKKRKKT